LNRVPFGKFNRVNFLIRRDLPGMRLFDVSFYHSVILPAGATGLPINGDIVRSSRLISRNKTKRSCTGSVNMTHHKAALLGATHKVIRQKSAECHKSQMPDVMIRTG
jgi:hypothetical protein